MRGATKAGSLLVSEFAYFNPRSSCEERRAVRMVNRVGDFLISIHAPHARSDLERVADRYRIHRFQSTLLMRGATEFDEHDRSGYEEFQSTLLMRGATRARQDACRDAGQISIHAPHARSDPAGARRS